MAKGATAHLQSSADVRAKVHKAGLDAFWHGVGREYRQAFGEHLNELAEHPDMHPALKPVFKFVARQPGEGAALLGTLWYGTGLGQTFGSILSNLLAPVVHTDLASNPNALLPPDLLAQLAAKGLYTEGQATSEARGAAIADWRFARMIQNARSYPDLGTVLDMWRRRIIGLDEVHFILGRLGYAANDVVNLAQLHSVPLQAADLADMTLRGILNQQEGRDRAELVGVPPADFDLLTLQVGEPPGPEQLVEALRRGFIPRERFVRGIRQSRIRDEWIDVEERLGYVPMSTADAVQAVVQNHLKDSDGKLVAGYNGLEPQYWDILVKTAGEPIARGEALELLNRGEMNQSEVEQAIRESRVKDRYIPQILKLRRRVPPERTVISMLTHGAVNSERAFQLLAELGFDHETSVELVKTGTAQRTGGARHVAVGVIGELYADQAIPEADALTMLEHLGYSHADALLELKVAELRREHTWRQSASTRIGTDYVDRLIDRGTVITYLDRIGLPALQRDRLLELWDLERGARRRRLTEAQIHAAVKRGAILPADGHARLIDMGYDETDAHILLSDVGG